MKNSSILFLLSFLLFGCSDIPERIADVKNPTSFVFNKSKLKVREAIIEKFGHLQFKDMILYFNGGKFRHIDTVGIFKQPGNEDDFYLAASNHFSIGRSCIYKMDNSALEYSASFHVHIVSIENNQTEVKIVTIKPRVVIGKDILPSGPHFVRQLKYYNVEPSTVEEYEILLTIGRALGQKGMPQLKKPE
jgi:hypothetical protein